MSDPYPATPARYQEAHSALNGRLLAYGLFAPLAIAAAFVTLGVTVNPEWFILLVLLPLFVPVMIYISLLYRNWPTGILIDEAGISIGAVGSSRATRRKPTINHQSWGLFTCPWHAVQGMRVITDRTELRANTDLAALLHVQQSMGRQTSDKPLQHRHPHATVPSRRARHRHRSVCSLQSRGPSGALLQQF